MGEHTDSERGSPMPAALWSSPQGGGCERVTKWLHTRQDGDPCGLVACVGWWPAWGGLGFCAGWGQVLVNAVGGGRNREVDKEFGLGGPGISHRSRTLECPKDTGSRPL